RTFDGSGRRRLYEPRATLDRLHRSFFRGGPLFILAPVRPGHNDPHPQPSAVAAPIASLRRDHTTTAAVISLTRRCLPRFSSAGSARRDHQSHDRFIASGATDGPVTSSEEGARFDGASDLLVRIRP